MSLQRFRTSLFIIGFTLTVVNDFRWFHSQFSTNCHEILQALFPNDAATSLKIPFVMKNGSN